MLAAQGENREWLLSWGCRLYLQGSNEACLFLLSVHLSSLSAGGSSWGPLVQNSTGPSYLLLLEVARPLGGHLFLSCLLPRPGNLHPQAVTSRLLSRNASKDVPLLSGAGHEVYLVLSVSTPRYSVAWLGRHFQWKAFYKVGFPSPKQ